MEKFTSTDVEVEDLVWDGLFTTRLKVIDQTPKFSKFWVDDKLKFTRASVKVGNDNLN